MKLFLLKWSSHWGKGGKTRKLKILNNYCLSGVWHWGTVALTGRLALGSVQQVWALLLAKKFVLGQRLLTSDHNVLHLVNRAVTFQGYYDSEVRCKWGSHVTSCVFLWMPSNIYLRHLYLYTLLLFDEKGLLKPRNNVIHSADKLLEIWSCE